MNEVRFKIHGFECRCVRLVLPLDPPRFEWEVNVLDVGNPYIVARGFTNDMESAGRVARAVASALAEAKPR